MMINMNLYLWKDCDGEWEWIVDSEKAFLFNYLGHSPSRPLTTREELEELESMVGTVNRSEIFLASKYILKVN